MSVSRLLENRLPPLRSIRYREQLARVTPSLFAISFLGLNYLGLQPVESKYAIAARLFVALCFAFFWLISVDSKMEALNGVPARVTYGRGVLALRGFDGHQSPFANDHSADVG